MIGHVLLGLYVVVLALMTLQSAVNLRMRLFIWERPEHANLNRSPETFDEPRVSFTVLLPARHEEAVIADTIGKICSSNYPKHLLQILVICEAGDTGTIAEVRRAISRPGRETVELIVFADRPINKPHGLNKGLQVARGDIVTIFDAEDEPHADIFAIINTIFSREPVDVVQSGVQLMNYDSHWFSALNVLEYFFWFKSSMHYFAWSGMVPLGGNTVFVDRRLLQQLGGWDERCLTEDADIGIRLSAAGARIRVVCDDEHVTKEETPHSITALVKQRTRWNQGFFQILLKGEWLHLPTTAQRVLAAYVLTVPFMQTLFSLMLPISVVMMVLAKLPIWLAMISFVPLSLFGLQACTDIVGLLEFVRVHDRPFSLRAFIFTVAGFFPYQALLAFSAARSVLRQVRRRNDWEKTAHTGLHRVRETAAG